MHQTRFVVCTLAWTFAAVSLGQSAVSTVTAQQMRQMSVDDTTGQIYACRGRELILLSSDARTVLQVVKLPIEIEEFSLRGKTVVARANSSNELFVVNLADSESSVRRIMLPEIPCAVFGSYQKPTYCYCAFDKRGEYSIRQISIDSLSVGEPATLTRNFQRPIAFKFSRGGVLCYWEQRLRRQSQHSQRRPTTFQRAARSQRLVAFDEDSKSLLSKRSQIQLNQSVSNHGPRVDASANLVVCGDEILAYSRRDFMASKRAARGVDAAVHPRYDLVVSLKGNAIWFESVDGKEEFGALSIRRAKGNNSDLVSPGQFHFDLISDRVLYFDKSQDLIHVIELKKAGIPLRPRIELAMPRSADAIADKILRLPIRQAAGNERPDVHLSVGNCKFANVDNENNIVLQPTTKDVGIHRLELTSECDGVVATHELRIVVSQRVVDLGFHVDDVEVTPSGEYAFVIGQIVGSTTVRPVAVVDLETLEVVAINRIRSFRSAAVTDKYVCLSSLPNSKVRRLSIPDLLPGTDIVARAAVDSLVRFKDDKIGVLTRGELALYEADVDKPQSPKRLVGHSNRPEGFIQFVDEQCVNIHGVVVDFETLRFVGLQHRFSFPTVAKQSPNDGKPGPRWLNTINLGSRTPLVALNSHYTLRPFQVRLFPENRIEQLRITRWNGETVGTVPLFPMEKFSPPNGTKFHRLTSTGMVVYSCMNFLGNVQLGQRYVDDLQNPIGVEFPRKTIFNVKDKAAISLIQRTDRNLRCEPLGLPRNVTVTRDGLLSLDLPAIWTEFTEATFSEASVASLLRSKETFERIVGAPLERGAIAGTVPINLRFRDLDTDEFTDLAFHIIAIGPQADIKTKPTTEDQMRELNTKLNRIESTLDKLRDTIQKQTVPN